MEIIKIFSYLKNQPTYRQQQVKQALFQQLANNWNQVTTLPQNFRQELNQSVPLTINGKILRSRDNQSAKAVITLSDSLKIETVLMIHKNDRRTVCVSSQVGCPLACKFCLTGRMGFKRNLIADEIIEQVIFWARDLKASKLVKPKVTNLVLMGMGEPLLNYDNVIKAIKVLNDHQGFNLGARHISLSTAGVVPGIQKLAKEKLQVNLAVSLHAADDQIRNRLMPINRKYPLEKLLPAIKDYIKKTKRKVMFEYLLLQGVNDSLDQARKLIAILPHKLAMVNLIAYNPGGGYKASASETINKFKQVLKQAGIEVTQRYEFGRAIKAACGQLIIEN